MNFINHLLTVIDTQVQHYTLDVYHSIVSTFYPTLLILLALYFAGLGWLVMRGMIPLTPFALAWHIFKASIIFILATRWEYISAIITHLFIQFPDYLTAKLLTPLPNSGTTTHSITHHLAQVWQTGINLFTDVWRQSGSDFLLGTLFGLMGYATVMGMVGIALFYIIMSKLILSILLILTPILLPLYLWEATRTVFNGWLRQLAKWAVIPIFIYTFTGLYLPLIQGQINSMLAAKNDVTTASISMFVLLGIIVIATYLQVGKIASDLVRHIHIPAIRPDNMTNVPTMLFRTCRKQEDQA